MVRVSGTSFGHGLHLTELSFLWITFIEPLFRGWQFFSLSSALLFPFRQKLVQTQQ